LIISQTERWFKPHIIGNTSFSANAAIRPAKRSQDQFVSALSQVLNSVTVSDNIHCVADKCILIEKKHRTVDRLCCRITLEQNDPRWVGAWWVGHLSLMVPTLLIAPAFFGYPPDPAASLYWIRFPPLSNTFCLTILYSCKTLELISRAALARRLL